MAGSAHDFTWMVGSACAGVCWRPAAVKCNKSEVATHTHTYTHTHTQTSSTSCTCSSRSFTLSFKQNGKTIIESTLFAVSCTCSEALAAHGLRLNDTRKHGPAIRIASCLWPALQFETALVLAALPRQQPLTDSTQSRGTGGGQTTQATAPPLPATPLHSVQQTKTP